MYSVQHLLIYHSAPVNADKPLKRYRMQHLRHAEVKVPDSRLLDW